MAAEVEIGVILNSGITISSVSVAIYLIKKWMNQREVVEGDIKKEAVRVAFELAARHKESCEEIKAKISDNRRYYETTYDDLSADNKEIIRLQRITNGRVNALETDLAVLKQAHRDRTGAHERQGDCL